jgi:hypothetical protein
VQYSDWPVLAYVAVGLLVFEAVHRFVSLPALVRLFDGRPRRTAGVVDAGRLAWLVTAVLHRTHRDAYCMRRSLLLFALLRRRGMPVRVCFGIARSGQGLTGHAWVELDGEPLAESADPRRAFVETLSYPSRLVTS